MRPDLDLPLRVTPKVEMDRDELLAMYERERLGTVWTLLRRARTAVGTCVVWVNA